MTYRIIGQVQSGTYHMGVTAQDQGITQPESRAKKMIPNILFIIKLILRYLNINHLKSIPLFYQKFICKNSSTNLTYNEIQTQM